MRNRGIFVLPRGQTKLEIERWMDLLGSHTEGRTDVLGNVGHEHLHPRAVGDLVLVLSISRVVGGVSDNSVSLCVDGFLPG